MKKHYLKPLLALGFFAIAMKSEAQWQLTGNANAPATSILGTTNAFPVNLTTNNLTRLTITSAGRVGIGIPAPPNVFSVKGSGGTPAASWVNSGNPLFSGFGEQTVGNADYILIMASSLANGRPVFIGRRARGTLAAPTVVFNNDQLSSFLVSGFDGSTFQNSAAVDFFVDGATSAGTMPARISFVTGTNSTNRVERLKIGSTGNITFNNNQFFLQQSSGAVGMGTTAPQSSALLDLTSTKKGILLPRMTLAQRDSITAPATGLLIYQTDTLPGLYSFNSSWTPVTPPQTSGANKALSNLDSATAINTSLVPDSTGFRNLGDTLAGWNTLFMTGDVYLKGNRFVSNPGLGNNFFGSFAGTGSTTGTFNTGTGHQALFSNTIGTSNTADGYQSLYTNTGTYNTASGYQSLFYNTIGYANCGSGAFSLYSNTTGSYNVAFGADALIGNTTGQSNTAVGLDAMRNLNTTNYNTGIGYYAGENTYDAIQGTFLGAQTRGGTSLSNVTAIGYGATATASNSIMLGNAAVTSVKAAGSFVIYSDGRFKTDVRENVPGLDFINKLRPVTYHYNIRNLNDYINPPATDAGKTGAARPKEDAAEKRVNEEAIQKKEQILYTGFVAQEVEAAARTANYDFSGLYKPANDKDVYGLSYADFVVPLVKAVQELSRRNDELKIKNEDQQRVNEELKKAKAEQAAINAVQQKQIDDLKTLMQKLLNDNTALSCPPLAGK